jgi:hypothetical protein
MAVMTLEHLVLRGTRVIGARTELKRIGAESVMERTSATPSFTRHQSHRSIQANYPLAGRDPRLAVRAGRPGSVSVVPVSGSPASVLWLAGRWSSGHATAKPAAPACQTRRGRPDPVQAPIARRSGPCGRLHTGLMGSTAGGALAMSLRGRGVR